MPFCPHQSKKSISDVTCFPEEEGGPSGLIRAFVSKAISSIPYVGDNLLFALEIMQEMDKVGKKTSQGSEDTPNKCMTQYISRTINKAIADKVRTTMVGYQNEFLGLRNKFLAWIRSKDFDIKNKDNQIEAVSRGSSSSGMAGCMWGSVHSPGHRVWS
jgi:hypothetical protein